MSIVTYVEEHPYLTGTLVVGGIIVFFLVRRSAGGGGTTIVAGGGPSESLQAMGLQAGSAVQMAQIQANAAVQGYNAQVNLAELYHAADTYKAGLDQKVQLEYIFAAKDVALAQTDAGLQLGLAQVGSITQQPVYGAGSGTPAGSMNIVAGMGTMQRINQVNQASQQQAISSALTTYTGDRDAAFVVGQGQGQIVHGVALNTNYGTLDASIAQANQAAINASYDLHPGSYLADGVYAHTPEAWKIYGDPSISYADAQARGYI